MLEKQTTKQKGDLLEEIVEKLCSDFDNSKVERNVKILGKSGTERQIDVLIQAKQNSFDIKIIVEAKNYSNKVGIEKVEALRTKLTDVGGNLGIIVCPLGFTEGAINAANLHDIQLFQVFDHKLGNTTQFIPLRYVIPVMKSYSLDIHGGASGGGTFEIPTDIRKWRVYIKNEIFSPEELAIYAWNSNMFPQKEGKQIADFGVVKISTIEDLKKFYYLELKMHVIVIADYYLKLFPVSFMKNIKSGKGNHQLFIDAYSKKEDMIKNGWKYFSTKEAMNEAAIPYETSDIKQLSITNEYTIEQEKS
jgi:hypothetical protein